LLFDHKFFALERYFKHLSRICVAKTTKNAQIWLFKLK
jgi:hypothetical protein